ncbi:MAG: helix-turn-helix domain-containing protein [Alphaproteobacteria bacterium]|nr:helix-turn-helix domain-containing protein [Alphaproteobacteria bacterium]
MAGYKHVLPTPNDIVAARGYLGWSQAELAERAGIGKTTLYHIEKKERDTTSEVLEKINAAFLVEGIAFQATGGFLANQNTFVIHEGYEGIRNFFEDVYCDIKDEGCDIFISGVDEKDFVKMRKRAGMDVEDFRNRMSRVPNLHFQVIISDRADKAYLASHIEYRATPDDDFVSSVPFYIYKNTVALILWEDKAPRIMVHHDDRLASAFLAQFKTSWKNATPVKI